MQDSTPEQLRFLPLPGYTVRADFDGGALSSDFGALLLRGIDRQIGLTERLAAAVRDTRHPSYIDHPLRDLFAQRIYQIASGYADGNDANSLRHDPMFKLSIERLPLEPAQDLASAPTFSRLEHSVNRPDLYRLTQAFVDHCMARYPEPPAAMVLDLDPSEDPTHGQQAWPFYNHHVSNHRGTRSGFSELEPGRIGKLPVEGAPDGVNEHRVGGSSLQTAGFLERQEAFDPPRTFVTVGALRAFTPHHGKSPGAFRAVSGGFHAVFKQKDPQRVHFT
ncbi:MAG: hypothetical protein EHM35_06145 [Planctomycetaceae bacterium]|nr:MAG: hypothetical protein EHM35_06145 [Planctomycetaceae bacterium]